MGTIIYNTPISKKEKMVPLRAILSALILFSVITNSAVPRYFLGTLSSELFSKMFVAQTAVFEYFTFSALPLDIVNALFAKNNPSAAADKTKPASEKNSDAIPVSEFSFINVERITEIVKNNTILYYGVIASLTTNVVLSVAKSSVDPPPGALAGAFSVFVLFFFLLPRSSVNDAYIRINKIAGYTARFEKSNRVFYFPRVIQRHYQCGFGNGFIYFPTGNIFKLFNFITSNFQAVVKGGYHEIY